MYYPVCEMVHIKEPLLLIGKSSLCGGSGFPLSQSEWSFTICVTPYNRKQNMLSASLNKTFPSFLRFLGFCVTTLHLNQCLRCVTMVTISRAGLNVWKHVQGVYSPFNCRLH